jgi:hypothetical protein
MARTSSNMPESTAICGNIETPRMVKRRRRRPVKLMRPSA